jgi:uncharacterized membrane protein YbjE (DUF340 family)
VLNSSYDSRERKKLLTAKFAKEIPQRGAIGIGGVVALDCTLGVRHGVKGVVAIG